MIRSIQVLEPTNDAINWEIFVYGDFDIARIDIVFDDPPTSVDVINVTKKSKLGSEYDTLIHTEKVQMKTIIEIENLVGFLTGDKILVEYPNANNIRVRGSAAVELFR